MPDHGVVATVYTGACEHALHHGDVAFLFSNFPE